MEYDLMLLPLVRPHAILVFGLLATLPLGSAFADPGAAIRPDRPVLLARIEVADRGIVRVTRADLEGVVPDIGERDPRGLNLVYKGAVVPIHFPGEEDGSFDEGDAFFFWGTYLEGEATTRGIYSETSVYFLRRDDEAPRRFRVSIPPEGVSPSPLADGALVAEYHFEPNYFWPYFQVSAGEETDFFFAEMISSAQTGFSRSVPIPNAAPESGKLTFEAKLFGRSSLPVNPDHFVRLYLNDHEMGTLSWDGTTASEFSVRDVPGEVLRAGSNTVRIVATGELEAARRVSPGPKDENGLAESAFDQVLLDWFRISYPVQLRAGRPDLWATIPNVFWGDAPSTGTMEGWWAASIRGFAEDGVLGLDIGTNSVVQASETVHADGTVTASLVFEGGPATKLRVATPSAMVMPRRVSAPAYGKLLDRVGTAELLVVAHPTLIEPLQRLVAHKREVGIATELVSVFDVYDQFNHGHKDPSAIRDFVSAVGALPDSRLDYLLLVGFASQNPKGLGRSPDQPGEDFIPTRWYPSTSFPPFSHDPWFGYPVNGSTRTPIVGRIPAHSVEQVAGAVDKIIAFETAGKAVWKNRAVMVSSQEGMFKAELEATADRLQQLAEMVQISRVFAEDFAEDNSIYGGKLVEEFDAGAGLLYFAGHGGGHVWRVGPNAPPPPLNNMFDLDNVERLQNAGKYPVVLAATCYTATFDFPKPQESIGTRLLHLPNAGAVAVVSSSYRCYFHPAARMFDRMIATMHDPEVRTLGEAFRRSLSDSMGPDSRESMTILGDPSLLIDGFRQSLPATDEAAAEDPVDE